MPKNCTLEERFWNKVDKSGDCWLWTACCHKDGYGKFGLNGNIVISHRLSYELNVGPIPDGICVLHKCDNPPCVNPEHLFLGTQSDNVADCLKKNRQARGRFHGRAILSEDQVFGVLAALNFGFDGRSTARLFGVSPQTISLIKNGHIWNHITGVKDGIIQQ